MAVLGNTHKGENYFSILEPCLVSNETGVFNVDIAEALGAQSKESYIIQLSTCEP